MIIIIIIMKYWVLDERGLKLYFTRKIGRYKHARVRRGGDFKLCSFFSPSSLTGGSNMFTITIEERTKRRNYFSSAHVCVETKSNKYPRICIYIYV